MTKKKTKILVLAMDGGSMLRWKLTATEQNLQLEVLLLLSETIGIN